MKSEIAAGGVVVHKRSDTTDVLLIRDMNDVWTFPKGIIEKGEDQVSAAAREVAEETGVTGVSHIAALTPIEYHYSRGGVRIHKTVAYHLFEVREKPDVRPQREEGISEVRWVSMDEAKKTIGYRGTNIKVLEETESKL